MLKKISTSEFLILSFILVLAAILRFYNYADFSLSNDELSALHRTLFDSFRELIDQGVKVDGHPAGVQVFIYYWIKLFGNSESALRFPFVLAGIISIIPAYLISKKWFSRETGFFVAVSLAVLEYTILNSQIARPYSFGLLFTLLSVYFWTRILFDESKQKAVITGFIISTSLVTYTHNYASFFIIITGLTGLFFINRNTWKVYFISWFLIILLYLPHLPIFLYQLEVGGIGGWLGKPKNDWLINYLWFVFNDSPFLFYSLSAGLLIMIVLSYKKLLNRFRIISLSWFLLSFLVGYYYSLYRNPVLHYSVLYFSFPFLLIFIFSFINPDNKYFLKIVWPVYTLLLLYSTLIEKDFYHTPHFSEFKKLAQYSTEWTEKYGEKNVTRVINLNQPYYIEYYLNKLGKQLSFDQYQCKEKDQLEKLKTIIDSTRTEYFLQGWSSIYNPYEIECLIRNKYEVIAEKKAFFNSEITLYKKGTSKGFLELSNSFEKNQWPADSLFRSSGKARTGKFSARINAETEFGPTYESKILDISSTPFTVMASVYVFPTDTNTDGLLTFHLELKGKDTLWLNSRFSDYIDPQKKEWQKVFVTFRVPSTTNPDDFLKLYIYNIDRKTFWIDDFNIKYIKEP